MSTETIAGVMTLLAFLGGGVAWVVTQVRAERKETFEREEARRKEDRAQEEKRRLEDRADRKEERAEDRAALKENTAAMQNLVGKLTSFDVQLSSLAESFESISNVQDAPKHKRARTNPHGIVTKVGG